VKNTSVKLYVISISISSLAGILFILSGYTKLFPVEYFESLIIDRAGTSADLSSWLARIIIGFEWCLGGLLLIRWRLKKITVPLAIISLIIFCIMLILQLISEGNDNNCGCFGNVWIMTPIEALIKNIVLLALLLFAVRINPKPFFIRQFWLYLIFAAAMSLPFVFNPGEIIYPSRIFLEQKEKIQLEILYNDSINKPPYTDLTKGKHVIAFMSLKCRHCRLAAYKMGAIFSKDTTLPVYFILNGDSAMLNDFLKETKTDIIPHSMFFGADKFLSLSGPELPSIFMVNDSYIEGELNYRNLNGKHIINWLASKQ